MAARNMALTRAKLQRLTSEFGGQSEVARLLDVDRSRVFDWDGSSLGRGDGGPLFVPRTLQGRGRHDNPATYGAWYWSRDSLSPIAEWLQAFRGRLVDDDDFIAPADRVRAVVGIEVCEDNQYVD